MKKLLIISYYWVPSGGAGVQRWVKFAKYLREFDWEPVIYTPEYPEYPSEDYSLEKDIPPGLEVIKTPIWEPYNIYRNLFGKKGEKINAGFISENKKSGWKDKLSVWIRGNFLIPDPRRFWIRPSVKFLSSYIHEHSIDAVVTTGPPHSMHRIGLGLKKKHPGLKWIADFRDPWTNIDFYKELQLTSIADKIHHRMEREVVAAADVVVVVSSEMKREFAAMKHNRIELITNGYDIEDIPKEEILPDKKFSIAHIGTLNAARNPEMLWKVLSELITEDDSIRKVLSIELIGKTDFSVLESIEQNSLSQHLNKTDYLNHSDAIKKQHASQVLLLLINNTANAKGILTGKFFEYMASGRPILAIGPIDGDVAEILDETGTGKIVGFEQKAELKQVILEYYREYKAGKLKQESKEIEKYSRRALTKELSVLLNGLTK